MEREFKLKINIYLFSYLPIIDGLEPSTPSV